MLRLRNWLRARIAGVIARTPSIRGRGRVVLLLDRLLTDSSDPASYTVTGTVNDGVRIVLDLRSWAQKFAFYYREWDREQIEVISREYGPGDFWDVGASIGLYTVALGRLCRSRGGRVVAVEPLLPNRVRLEEHLGLNGLGDLVTVVPCAMGETNGSVKMSLTEGDMPGNAVVSAHGNYSVQLSTLDDLWARMGRRRIGFIKVDTEGWDASVILGGRHAIAECRPNMHVEFNRERMAIYGISLDRCWSFLTMDLGYRCFRCHPNGHLEEIAHPGDCENLLLVAPSADRNFG